MCTNSFILTEINTSDYKLIGTYISPKDALYKNIDKELQAQDQQNHPIL